MVELFKFRCYHCQKLIGAPPSRFGSQVKCPKCGVDLVVPSPDDPEETETDPDAFRPEDLGLNLDPGPLRMPSAPPAGPLPPAGPDPIAFLNGVADEGEGERQAAEDEAGGESEETVLIEPADEPLVPRRRGRSAAGGSSSGPRPRDVVLPRTAAVAWALSALLGLAFAFLAGVLIGQRMGK